MLLLDGVIKIAFGEKLRNCRKNRNLTQKELAKKIGAKHTSISNWEKEQNIPDGNKILLLLKALEISPEMLLGYFCLNDLEEWEEKKNNGQPLTIDQRAALEYVKAVSADTWNKLDADTLKRKSGGFDLETIMKDRPLTPSSGTNWIKELSHPLFSGDELAFLNDYNLLNDAGKAFIKQTMKTALIAYPKDGGATNK